MLYHRSIRTWGPSRLLKKRPSGHRHHGFSRGGEKSILYPKGIHFSNTVSQFANKQRKKKKLKDMSDLFSSFFVILNEQMYIKGCCRFFFFLKKDVSPVLSHNIVAFTSQFLLFEKSWKLPVFLHHRERKNPMHQQEKTDFNHNIVYQLLRATVLSRCMRVLERERELTP